MRCSVAAGNLAERAEALRVAVFGVPAACSYLRRVLELNGVCVVLERTLREGAADPLDASQADVLLVELQDLEEQETMSVDRLLQRVSVPVLFHDASGMQGDGPEQQRHARRLVAKLVGLAAPEALEPVEPPAAPAGGSAAAERPPLHLVGEAPPARNVWALGASIGGPPAVKRFLAALPAGTPAAFVLSQHIGGNFVAMLATQLDRACGLNVAIAHDGQRLREGDVALVPVGSDVSFDGEGLLRLLPANAGPYAPSIDATMAAVAAGFGDRAGAVLFSGMGRDGLRGAHAVVEAGGEVWCQAPESCVVSSMVDAVTAMCLSSRSGSDEDLAAALHQRLAG